MSHQEPNMEKAAQVKKIILDWLKKNPWKSAVGAAGVGGAGYGLYQNAEMRDRIAQRQGELAAEDNRLRNALLIAGGVVSAGGLGYLLLNKDKDPKTAELNKEATGTAVEAQADKKALEILKGFGKKPGGAGGYGTFYDGQTP